MNGSICVLDYRWTALLTLDTHDIWRLHIWSFCIPEDSQA